MQPPHAVSPRSTNKWVVLAILCISLFVVALDATVLYVALPELSDALSASDVERLWIVDIYSLVIAGALLTTGTLADRFGRKRMLVSGFVVFGIASALAAIVDSPGWLIAARAALGIGGAMIMPPTLSIIRQVFLDPRERSVAIGLWSAVAAGGASVGPILGGFLLEHYWWGSVFLINVPIMILAVPIGALLISESRDPRPGRWDAVSAAIAMIGIVGIVYAIKAASHGGHWIAALLSGGGGLLLLWWFVRRQRQLSPPFFDVGLFRDPRFGTAAACALLATFGIASEELFVAQYFQYVLGDSPLVAGLRLLPLMGAALLAAPATAFFLHRYGVRVTATSGLLLIAAALLVFAAAGAELHPVALSVVLVFIGIGASIALTAGSDTLISVAPPTKAGAAAAIDEISYELGIGLGVAVGGSLLGLLYMRAVGNDAEPDLGMTAAEKSAFTDALVWTVAFSAVVLIVAAAVAWRMFPKHQRP